MPFTRPTLAQISDRIRGDITVKMGSQSSTLRRAWTSIYARALAGAVHLVYGYMEWAYKQFFATTAEREALIEKGKIYGLGIKPAQFAEGFIHVTGANGSPVPVDTVFKTVDGLRYAVDVAATITLVGGEAVADVHVVAIDAGVAGNLPSGTVVTLESPVAGVNNSAVVAGTTPGSIDGGSEEETTEAFRARYLLRTRNPPQGGSKADYEIWAKEVSGIGEAIVYPPLGIIPGPDNHALLPGESYLPPIGEVWVYLATTDADNPTPAPGDLTAAQVYLNEKKPVTATVKVFGIVPAPITFVLSNTQVNPGYSIADVITQATAELKDLFIREAKPFATITRSQMIEAISATPAEKSHILVAPAADVTFAYNEFGTVATPITVT